MSIAERFSQATRPNMFPRIISKRKLGKNLVLIQYQDGPEEYRDEIAVKCPKCKTILRLRDGMAPKIKCQKCGKTFILHTNAM